MKVNFTNGEGEVTILYDKVSAPAHLNKKTDEEVTMRTTTVTVTLPGGEKFSSESVCHTQDQFSKRAGRFYCLMKLLDADTEAAVEKTLKTYQDEILKRPEGQDGLSQAAKAHYQLSRADRRILTGVVCPEFTRNTPARKAQREKALYERLKAKYEPGLRQSSTVNVVNQAMGDVGGVVIGVVNGVKGRGMSPKTLDRRRAAK